MFLSVDLQLHMQPQQSLAYAVWLFVWPVEKSGKGMPANLGRFFAPLNGFATANRSMLT